MMTTAGMLNDFTVTVEDAFGNVVTGYTGTVHFSSDDTGAVLPRDYVFMASDLGTHTFQAAFTAGTHYLRAADAVLGISGEENGIVVV